MNPVVAIDGPAASGKSTVSKLVAQRLQYTYVDTGSMYRAFAWFAAEEQKDPGDREAVKNLIKASNFRLQIEEGLVGIRLRDIDPRPHLRSESINKNVSAIASIPELREFLVNEQRKLRLHGSLVVEGRDIGTVVFSDTPYKFFLDAPPEVRARRRSQEGHKDETARRDHLDRTRANAPLIRAADAELIDTSEMTPDEIAEHIIARSKELGLVA